MTPDRRQWSGGARLFAAVRRALTRTAIRALLVAAIVGIASFFVTQALPGDAAYRIAAGRYGYDLVDTAAAAAVRQELGLDRPATVRLVAWLADLSRGRLGVSMVSGEPVWTELSHQLGHTVLLAVTAWLLALGIGAIVGVVTALLNRPWIDRIAAAGAAMLRATPAFVLGLALALVFAVRAGWLPAAGHGEPAHLVLPAVTLALGLAAGLSQVVALSIREVLRSAYVVFARTKGIGPRAVVVEHVVRNAAVPIVAYAGAQLVLLIEGVVVVETFFAWPGIGHALVHAVVARDVPMIQGAALCMGLLFVVLNALVDAACELLDPRMRRGASTPTVAAVA